MVKCTKTHLEKLEKQKQQLENRMKEFEPFAFQGDSQLPSTKAYYDQYSSMKIQVGKIDDELFHCELRKAVRKSYKDRHTHKK